MSEGPQTRQRGKVVLGRNQPPVPQTTPTPNTTGTPPPVPRRQWVNQTRVLVGLQPGTDTGDTPPPTRTRSGGGTPPTPPPTVSSTPQVQPSPRRQRDDVQYNALYSRLETVKGWMKDVRQTHPDVVEKMIEWFRAAGTELGDDNYGVASGHLDKLELVIKKFDEQLVGSMSSEPSTPKSGKKPPSAEELQGRLYAIGQFIKTLEQADGEKWMQAFTPAHKALKGNLLEECELRIGKLEDLIAKRKSGSGSSGTTPPTTPPITTPTTPHVQPQNTGPGGTTTTTTTTTVPQTPPQTPPQGVGTGGPTTVQQGTPPTGTTPPITPPTRPTGQLPMTPTEKAKGKFDAAKRGVDAFTQDPNAEWNTVAARKTINDRKQEMLSIVDSEANAEDDIQRKGIIFDSKDKDYHKNVTTLVKTTMANVRPALADPTTGTSAAIKTLNDAVNKLAIEKRYYANLKGITDRDMLDQRKRKTAAIDGHIKEIQKVVSKLQSILKIKYEPMLNLLDTLPELMANDAGEAQTASRQVGALLADANAREEFFQTVGKAQADALIVMLGTPQTEPLAKELAITRASDNDFMDDLCQKAVAKEAADVTDKGTFFRANTLATKLAANYTRNSPDGKAYCEETLEKVKGLLKGKGSMELDNTRGVTDREVTKNLASNKKVLSDSIDALSDPSSVPPEIAKLSAQFYREAQRVAPGDDEFANTQAGGFIVLRVINPELLDRLADEMKSTNEMIDGKKKVAKQKWTSSGNNASDFEYEVEKKDQATLDRIKEEQRAITLQTKVLQNIANGVEFGAKEQYMIPMNASIKSGSGYAPPAAKFRKFLKDTADRGQNL